MTFRQKLIVGLLCGATLLGGAAWAAGGPERRMPSASARAAEATGRVEALFGAAQLGPLLQIIATEGARHGLGLEASLFPGRGGDAWRRAVAAIQSPDRLRAVVASVLTEELRGADLSSALAFYATALGEKVAAREVASRRAMLDADVEAGAVRASMRLDESDRARLVSELISTLDLVTANVSGGLNANLAFYRGLGDGGALVRGLTEREMLLMVWDQEDEIRAATSRWLRAHLTLAYAPLSDGELRDYIAFSASAAGRRLSAATIAAFGRVFEDTSYELGLAAARFLTVEDA